MRLASAFRANHRNESKPHKLVIFKHSGRQFTMLTFFSFINICIEGAGQIHAVHTRGAGAGVAVPSYFLLERHVRFPSFLSPCRLDTAASELCSHLPLL